MRSCTKLVAHLIIFCIILQFADLKMLHKIFLKVFFTKTKPSVNNLMFLKNLIIFTKANFIVTKCNEIRFFFSSLKRKKYIKLYTCGV